MKQRPLVASLGKIRLTNRGPFFSFFCSPELDIITTACPCLLSDRVYISDHERRIISRFCGYCTIPFYCYTYMLEWLVLNRRTALQLCSMLPCRMLEPHLEAAEKKRRRAGAGGWRWRKNIRPWKYEAVNHRNYHNPHCEDPVRRRLSGKRRWNWSIKDYCFMVHTEPPQPRVALCELRIAERSMFVAI